MKIAIIGVGSLGYSIAVGILNQKKISSAKHCILPKEIHHL